MSIAKQQIIVIAGPTSSGKTALSLKLAKQFQGEIISADSRQVYRGMDIGTGKATKQEQRQAPHHLLDVASPKYEYNVAHFKRDAQQAIKKIHSKGKLPILVGGTGFWIQAVIEDLNLPTVKPNKLLRQQLAKKTTKQLFSQLKKLDPKRAQTIDPHNPYRLIRAIEIIKATGHPIQPLKKQMPYQVLYLGIRLSQNKLFQRIDRRLTKRFQQGMIAEVRRLHRQGVSWQRLDDFGLEYRYISRYLRGQLTLSATKEQLRQASHHYAKRQMTWFNKNKAIHWISDTKQAILVINNFLHNR